MIVDERGEIVLVNTEAESMFGYRRHELIGRRVEVLVPAAARREHGRQRAGFMREAHGRQMGSGRELCARRKDASEFPVEIGLGRLQTDDGVLISSPKPRE